jgi:hypothetical protein
MGRALLNNLPDWGLILIFIAVAVVIGLGAEFLVRTRLPAWRAEASSQSILAISAIAMTFFALVLALVVVDLYTAYKDASAGVTAEANSLIKIIQDADAFPPQEEHAIMDAVHKYVAEVENHEFPALRQGTEDPLSLDRLLQISVALRSFTPQNQTQVSFYDSAVSQVNDLIADRDTRVSDADSSVPRALVALLLVLSGISFTTVVFLKVHHPGLDIVLVLSVSLIIGLGLATVLILEYPFSGSIAVSSDPFRQVLSFSALTQGP